MKRAHLCRRCRHLPERHAVGGACQCSTPGGRVYRCACEVFTFQLLGSPHIDKPCPSCTASRDILRGETLMPLPADAWAPRGRSGPLRNKPICFDCAAAEGLLGTLNWDQARIAVANDRQEKLRLSLPGRLLGIPTVRGAQLGDLETLHAFQTRHHLDEADCD